MPCKITLPLTIPFSTSYIFRSFLQSLFSHKLLLKKKERNLHFWVRQSLKGVLTAISFRKIENETMMQALHLG